MTAVPALAVEDLSVEFRTRSGIVKVLDHVGFSVDKGETVALVGATAAISGHVIDDARPVGGGGEVLVEPTRILIGPTQIAGAGNLLVRWRGSSEPALGDIVVVTGSWTRLAACRTSTGAPSSAGVTSTSRCR